MEKPNKTIDALLIVSFQSGDKKAFSLLVKRWNDRLCIQAFRYTNDWDAAKDLTQDTWKTILAKIHFLKDSNSFGSWAMTIVSRKAIDYIKKESKYNRNPLPKILEQEEEPTEDEGKQKQVKLILDVLKTLPTDQRMVLKLFYIEEYSLKEISEITQTSLNTVKTRLFRAREKMKSIIKK